ncbi:unnamed protein product [Brassicogethes aeneus]|uniref:Uncharacterized protein n=1 Tax=Brassicogethes aeneus TaxID=1431903 RepID=A0A9P0B6E0_BRAAE|nr:unnamed protein product [Brassicogethes aeneus]
MDDANTTVGASNVGSKKRQKNRTKRQENKLKRTRASAPGVKSFKKPCLHKGPTYCCSEINLGDVQDIRTSFNATNAKIQQDIKLCHFLSATAVDRKRSIKNQPRKREFTHFRFRTGTEQYSTLTKSSSRGTLHSDLKERSLADRRGIPEKKKKSLENLLSKQFGKDWKNDKDLAWYNDLLGRQGINIEDETSDSEPCDCLAEDIYAVHI